MITYVIPTRNRNERLQHTLSALASLDPHEAQIIIADNASDVPPAVPIELDNNIPVRVLMRDTNEGAAARNAAVNAADPRTEWIVMLDDDSYPTNTHFLESLNQQPTDVAAVAAEINLPDQNKRESGGLPEVFIGCGVAIRKDAFLQAQGYDPAFGYYAEEYDLCAKLMLDGGRIILDRRFNVNHHKVQNGRNMDLILRRLVRNNAWVTMRYAPARQRKKELREIITRYASIAVKERAELGYLLGLAQLTITSHKQRFHRREMNQTLFDRFTGLDCARHSLQCAYNDQPFHSACLIAEGKNAWAVKQALAEMNVHTTSNQDEVDALVIATLSPGPLLDAWDTYHTSHPRVITPWHTLIADQPHNHSVAHQPEQLQHVA